IGYQMITFLTAGHETTSGLLTFATYFLLENPDVLANARSEVDRVLGNQNPRFEHLAALTYVGQVLKESLRVLPPLAAFALHPMRAPPKNGRGDPARHDQLILVSILPRHRDPKVWPDPERFDPERFAPGVFEKLPPNSWKPFGNGQRACIGRAFA